MSLTSAGVFILAVFLAMYSEANANRTGKGTATRRYALDKHMRAHRTDTTWHGELLLHRAMEAALPGEKSASGAWFVSAEVRSALGFAS